LGGGTSRLVKASELEAADDEEAERDATWRDLLAKLRDRAAEIFGVKRGPLQTVLAFFRPLQTEESEACCSRYETTWSSDP
jgi:hypothetical protein